MVNIFNLQSLLDKIWRVHQRLLDIFYLWKILARMEKHEFCLTYNHHITLVTLVSYHLEEGSLFCLLLHPDNLDKRLEKTTNLCWCKRQAASERCRDLYPFGKSLAVKFSWWMRFLSSELCSEMSSGLNSTIQACIAVQDFCSAACCSNHWDQINVLKGWVWLQGVLGGGLYLNMQITPGSHCTARSKLYEA